MVANGIDHLEIWRGLLADKKVGLPTNAGGYNTHLQHNVDAMHAHGICLPAWFAPKQRLLCAAAAREHADLQTDAITGLPVYSLYRKDSKCFAANRQQRIDALRTGAAGQAYLAHVKEACKAYTKQSQPFWLYGGNEHA